MTRSCALDQDEELFNVGNIEGVKRSLQDSVMSIKMSMMHPTWEYRYWKEIVQRWEME